MPALDRSTTGTGGPWRLVLAAAALLPVAALLTLDFRLASVEGDKATWQGGVSGPVSAEQQRAIREGSYPAVWGQRWDAPPALLFLQSDQARIQMRFAGVSLERDMFFDILKVGAISCLSPLQSVP